MIVRVVRDKNRLRVPAQSNLLKCQRTFLPQPTDASYKFTLTPAGGPVLGASTEKSPTTQDPIKVPRLKFSAGFIMKKRDRDKSKSKRKKLLAKWVSIYEQHAQRTQEQWPSFCTHFGLGEGLDQHTWLSRISNGGKRHSL